MRSHEEQRRLLVIARMSLEARVRRLARPPGDPARDDSEHAGAFVTVLVDGDLRGCLGRIVSDLPIEALVRDLAASVADSDPRFDPVRVEELSRTTIEISVLSPAREVQELTEIDVGRHGLIAEQGSRRGLLLPQVAVDRGWDVPTFVAHTCLKAGLPQDAWRRGAVLSVFEADVFGEAD